jgi:hypothetical protein|tara:strand:- start:396 stop:668 length:273 start_codon:yes stop_codon:yes gene_type:complete
MPPEICENCGANVPPNAIVCPKCGTDEETGWNENVHTQGLGLPDEDFDYDEFIEREFGDDKPGVIPHSLHWFWWLVGISLIGALICMWVL